MLQDQVLYLYSMVTGADQKPGRDAAERLAELIGPPRRDPGEAEHPAGVGTVRRREKGAA